MLKKIFFLFTISPFFSFLPLPFFLSVFLSVSTLPPNRCHRRRGSRWSSSRCLHRQWRNMLFFTDLVVGTTKSDGEEHEVIATVMATTGMELWQLQGPINDGDATVRSSSRSVGVASVAATVGQRDLSFWVRVWELIKGFCVFWGYFVGINNCLEFCKY